MYDGCTANDVGDTGVRYGYMKVARVCRDAALRKEPAPPLHLMFVRTPNGASRRLWDIFIAVGDEAARSESQ
jgi:hypothetical protein